jgi:ribosomal protein L23
MTKKLNNKTKHDTTAAEIATLFNCTDRYVRMLIADEDSKRYKGDRAKMIRKAYWQLKAGKNKLLQSVSKLVPFLKAS